MILLIESQYFAPVSTYLNLIKSTHVDFCLSDPYRKMSFRNRCILPGANGLINLTVPVAGGRDQKNPMKDVRIDYTTDWQKIHWRTIFSVYGNSPWFEYYSSELELLYMNKFEYLAELNSVGHRWVSEKLGMVIPEINSRQIENAEIRDLRNGIVPSNFHLESFGPFPDYPQVFEDKTGFKPNMSILDLLFCEGKRAAGLLRKYSGV